MDSSFTRSKALEEESAAGFGGAPPKIEWPEYRSFSSSRAERRMSAMLHTKAGRVFLHAKMGIVASSKNNRSRCSSCNRACGGATTKSGADPLVPIAIFRSSSDEKRSSQNPVASEEIASIQIPRIPMTPSDTSAAPSKTGYRVDEPGKCGNSFSDRALRSRSSPWDRIAVTTSARLKLPLSDSLCRMRAKRRAQRQELPARVLRLWLFHSPVLLIQEMRTLWIKGGQDKNRASAKRQHGNVMESVLRGTERPRREIKSASRRHGMPVS
jgi:hypothetical protein